MKENSLFLSKLYTTLLLFYLYASFEQVTIGKNRLDIQYTFFQLQGKLES
jgi:hypothetical protein